MKCWSGPSKCKNGGYIYFDKSEKVTKCQCLANWFGDDCSTYRLLFQSKSCNNDSDCSQIKGICTDKPAGLRYHRPAFEPYVESKNRRLKTINFSTPRVCYCQSTEYYSGRRGTCVPVDPCAKIETCAQHEGGVCEFVSGHLYCTCPYWLKGDKCQDTVPKWTNMAKTTESCDESCEICNITKCIDHRGRKLEESICENELGSLKETQTTEFKEYFSKCKVQYIILTFFMVCPIVGFFCFIYNRRKKFFSREIQNTHVNANLLGSS